MKILSLFGGFEAGRMALDKLGIVPTEYYSAEVDKYAIQNASHNYHDIIHVGGVTEVDGTQYRDLDWLIGGPPCQDLSIAGKRAGLQGARSGLFYEYVRILNEAKPKFFLVENVASMPKEANEEITKELFGIEPVLINSALVSAQNRKRLFWVGRRNSDGTYSKVEISQPEDKGLVLRDILEDIPLTDERWKPLPEKYVEAVKAKIEKFKESGRQGCLSVHNTNPSGRGMNGNVFYDGAKSPAMTTNKGEGNKILGQFRRSDIRIHADQDNSPTLTANMGTGGNNVPIILEPYCLNPKVDGKQPSLSDRIYHDEAKSTAVTTSFITNVVTSEKSHTIKAQYQKNGAANIVHKTMEATLPLARINTESPQYLWRKLTVRECARLQTFPEHYEFPVSASRAYKGIGNSWTVDVIVHIFKTILCNSSANTETVTK